MVWLLPAGQGGFIGHVPVYRTDMCSGFPPPQQLFRENGNLGRMIQRW